MCTIKYTAVAFFLVGCQVQENKTAGKFKKAFKCMDISTNNSLITINMLNGKRKA